MKPVFLLSALVLAACTDVAAPTLAVPTHSSNSLVFSETADFESVLTSCSGEPILFTGTYRTRSLESKNTVANTLDYHGTGVGLDSGKHYSVRYLSDDHFNEVSDVYRVRFTVTGGGERPFEYNIYYHTVVANGGSNTNVVDRAEVGCD